MRVDDPTFAAQNRAPAKHMRLVVRIIFDVATIYVTSDENMINVPGTPLLGHLKRVSGVTQQINPDEGRATIGSLSFDLVDLLSEMTAALRYHLQLEFQNLRGRTVQMRFGYTEDYNDTQILMTQAVRTCEYNDGTYRIGCNDIQRIERKDIFDKYVTNLRLTVNDLAAVIPVIDTTGFEPIFHGTSYSDAPNSVVGYIKIEDEIIRYTGTTADTFTGCTRGVFNTVPATHEVEANTSDDRQPEVEEFIYLELPGPKLAYAVLTGILNGDVAYTDSNGDPVYHTLPDHWHLGIDPIMVA